jgi:hypothetical protein
LAGYGLVKKSCGRNSSPSPLPHTHHHQAHGGNSSDSKREEIERTRERDREIGRARGEQREQKYHTCRGLTQIEELRRCSRSSALALLCASTRSFVGFLFFNGLCDGSLFASGSRARLDRKRTRCGVACEPLLIECSKCVCLWVFVGPLFRGSALYLCVPSLTLDALRRCVRPLFHLDVVVVSVCRG